MSIKMRAWIFYIMTALLAAGSFNILVPSSRFEPIIRYLGAVNAAAFFSSFIDKISSRNNGLRLPELLSLSLALIGGSLALLLSISLLRHKSRKGSFQLVLTSILCVQILALKLIFLKN